MAGSMVAENIIGRTVLLMMGILLLDIDRVSVNGDLLGKGVMHILDNI